MKQILIVITIVAVICFGMPVAVNAFSGGDGTKENPYIISSAKELDAVRYNLSAYYKLGCDIDLTKYLSEGGEGYTKWGESGWEPIGNSKDDEWFLGSFDGAGHTISGLWIDRKEMDCVGLFAGTGTYIREISVQNLGIEIAEKGIAGNLNVGGLTGNNWGELGIVNCFVKGGRVGGADNVGGLIGNQNVMGVTKNCYSEVEVVCVSEIETAYSRCFGGLIGIAGGAIENCYATGDVKGLSRCGGLVGHLESMASIADCYATGNVIATGDYVGGIAGYCHDGTIMDSYSTGDITGKSYVGGLLGLQAGKSGIGGCYHKGKVTATEDYAGGLVGAQISEPYFQNYNSISDCYAEGSVETTGEHAGAISGYMDTESSISNCYRYADFTINGAEVPKDDENSAPDKINGGYYSIDEPPLPSAPEVWFDGGVEIVLPDKTVYTEGEVLDLTGLEAYETAGIVYTDGSVKYTMMEERTPVVEMENKPLTVNDTTVTVSIWLDFIKSPVNDSFEITVYPKSTIQLLGSDGNAVESLKSGDVVSAKAVCSTSVSEKSGVYMALYDKDGVLKDVKFSLQPVKTDENITFTTESMTIPENSEGYYVKMFLWTDGLEPLSNTVTIK